MEDFDVSKLKKDPYLSLRYSVILSLSTFAVQVFIEELVIRNAEFKAIHP